MEQKAGFEILLIDDNRADVRMVREGLKFVGSTARLSVAVDGIDALRRLRRDGEYSAVPAPDLILLDLRLPKKNGFEVLREVKQDPLLASIPVVVQSSSETPEDICGAYRLHANCYVNKITDLDEFGRKMRILIDFWTGVVKLPQGEHFEK